jgi:hypothetical protein
MSQRAAQARGADGWPEPAHYPSVRLARARWLRPDVRCVNLEHVRHAELLAEMAAVLERPESER